jgi:uncharacterized protein
MGKKGMDILMEQTAEEDLGKAIQDTPVFQKIMEQKHHHTTNVGDHSIAVEQQAMKFCDALDKIGLHTDRKCVSVAAMCHDLGMADRKNRYKNDIQCWTEHAENSVEEARKLIPDLDEKTEDAIRCHMWPLSRHAPASKEGWILIAADKYVSTADSLKKLMKGKRKKG